MMAFSQAAAFDKLGGGLDRAATVRRLDVLAQLMDNAFLIPGLNRRVGLDAIIGLVPGIGDAVTTLVQSYIIWEARRLGAPAGVIARMVGNVALDGMVGVIPFVGDLFDAGFKANIRNMRILREYLARSEPDLLREAGTRPADGRPNATVIDAEYRVVRGGR
jgi:hypothetical protein